MLARKSARRLARDVEIDDDTMESAIEFLKSKLSPTDLSHLKTMLKGEQAEAEDDDPDEKEREKLAKAGDKKAKDSGPASFKGMPRTAGSMASDAKGQSFNDRWPQVARIGHGY